MNNNNIIFHSIDIIENLHEAILSLALLARYSEDVDSKHVGNILTILHENLQEEHNVLLFNLKTQ